MPLSKKSVLAEVAQVGDIKRLVVVTKVSLVGAKHCIVREETPLLDDAWCTLCEVVPSRRHPRPSLSPRLLSLVIRHAGSGQHGHALPFWFQGGQTPIWRLLPKRGSPNP